MSAILSTPWRDHLGALRCTRCGLPCQDPCAWTSRYWHGPKATAECRCPSQVSNTTTTQEPA